MTFVIEGLRDIEAGLAAVATDTARALRSDLRHVAEPVKRDAETLAVAKIRNVGSKWSRMRIGATTRLVYVAPRQRGVKSKASVLARRPNLAGLLMDRAMEPALHRNEQLVEHELERIVEGAVRDFNKA